MADDRFQLIGDAEQTQRQILQGWQVGIWTALPGLITKVDFATMTCEVQPAIQAIVVDSSGGEKVVNLPVLLDVPILFPSCKGFLITMPLAVNDEVLVVIASRCIDAWWQNGGIQQAVEARMHDLSDGFAIPGVYSQPSVPGMVSTTDLQIRNFSGNTYVSITADGKIKLVAATEIDITAPTVKITGDVDITGDIDASGDITAGGVSLDTHIHTGGTLPGGFTGAPV